MERHEAYSVLITDDRGRRGTGTLFYTKDSSYFYVLTCAHVIYTSEAVSIHLLIPSDGDPTERVIRAEKNQFHFSPIDEVTRIGCESIHTCDIAIIECPLDDLALQPTRYSMYPMSSGERIIAIGYPQSTAETVYYQQDELAAKVLRIQDNQNHFIIRVDEDFLNVADRESEIKGFSGAPVWDEEKINEQVYLLGGLIAVGVGNNISRGRVNVMSALFMRSLMIEEFGVSIDMRLPTVVDGDIAPGFEELEETADQIAVRSGWIENERRKAQTYINSLQLQKAVDSSRAAISNSEFVKCTNNQKLSIYGVLQEAYRLARDYDIYDQISEEMRLAGIHNDRFDLTETVRYYEALDNDRAEVFIKKALERNPNGNKERILSMAIHASKEESADISIVSEFLGSRDQLLIKPKDNEEEEFVYQMLGFVLANRFRETTRALRCLNRAFQISGNYIILESLALTYYLHSIKDAFVEEGNDRIDRSKIKQGEIDKARDAFLRVFSVADEMWLKGTFRRAGLPVFKCFFFMRDNFRIYKHYHDVMKYVDFPNQEIKRDIQICYIDVAILKEQINLDDFDALTDHDKRFYELAMQLDILMRLFSGGLAVEAPITEVELLNTLMDGERKLKELIETQTDDRIGFDGIHSVFANLYGNGVLRFHWQALSDVKRHVEAIVNPDGIETFQIYIDELQTENLYNIEKRYEYYFEKHRNIISFEEWCHFYIRHGWFEKAKTLYNSVFEERKYLIETQPEYFYREYIAYTLAHRFDLTPAIKCLVERRDEFKDIYIYMSFEMDLNFATCTFNDPNRMLEDARILLDEGLYTKADYDEKCLIINMLNCRPEAAEQFACWAHGVHPLCSTKYERMLLVWKGVNVVPNKHWNSMQQWLSVQMFDIYSTESWLRDPKEILLESATAHNKAIVADLWTIYYFVKAQAMEVLANFKTIYITHNTVAMALQEIDHVNDDDIRRVLIHLHIEGNIKILSPTLEQQLTVRDGSYTYTEIHSACLLAQELNIPAFVGEFRIPIPEMLRSKVIRPSSLKDIIECVTGRKMLEEHD